MYDSIQKHLRYWKLYLFAGFKWLFTAVFIGLLCGLLGSVFHICVDKAQEYFSDFPWLLYLLPVAGLAIVAIYKFCRTEGVSTDAVIEEVHSGRGLSIALVPSIFFSTILTHLCGGSAGKEGAALQLGGALGFSTGKIMRLDESDLRTATMVGMSAFFAAVFGTPVTAAVFTLSIISVGLLYHAALLPCLISSVTAYIISRLFGIAPTHFNVTVPEFDVVLLLKVIALSILCAFVSVLFCSVIHGCGRLMKKYIKSAWLRIVFGAVLIILLTVISGTREYNSTGMGIIISAVEQGAAVPCAFILKLIFTAVTFGAGFKGGEVVPSFFVGATFACIVGPVLGIPAGFAAAVGLVSVFCGAVNSPVASTVLAVELFGADGVIYFALACAISFVFSGYSGLYSKQYIVFSKLKAKPITATANSYREE